MWVKLPDYIKKLEDGPHKRDIIKHFKKMMKKNAKDRRRKDR